jgi:hypothetical protein
MRYSDDGLAQDIVKGIAQTYTLPTAMVRAVSAGDHNTCFHCGCEVEEDEDCCKSCRPGKSRTSVSQLMYEGYPREAIDVWQEAGLLAK